MILVLVNFHSCFITVDHFHLLLNQAILILGLGSNGHFIQLN